MMRILAALVVLICLSGLPGQMAHAQLRTQIFDSRFRTLKVANPEDFYAQPVIRLGSSDRLLFSFDEIGDDNSYLEYRLVHCNADWRPSQLIESEYLPRFNSAKVDDFGFSSNTYVHYVNYHIELPNDDMSPLVSGNYVLQVYPEGEPDNVLLQARFCVSEGRAIIGGSADGRTDRETDESLQQVRFRVETPGMSIRDPFTELLAVVEQNADPDGAHVVARPLSVSGSALVYEHSPELIFPAGNEYRRFETVRADYPGMHVDSVRFGGSNYHAYLATDFPRDDRSYSFDSTQKGRFLVREHNATDSDLGADYVTVHFTLDISPLADADVYVQGEFTGYLAEPRYRMNYNPETRRYEAQIPLKQGAYNYRYVVVPRGSKSPTQLNPIEGDKYETLNEYTIKLYYRTPGARADRLLGNVSFVATP